MRKKIIAIILASVVFGSLSPAAKASERVTVEGAYSTSYGGANLQTAVTPNAIHEVSGDSAPQSATSQGNLITLGISYFSSAQNQGIRLSGTFGECITDSKGCWSQAQGRYLQILVNLSKLNANETIGHQGVTSGLNKAAAAKKPSPISIVSDIATLVGIAAVVVVVLAASPAVVAVAGTVAAVSGAAVASIYLCQKYLGCSH